MRGLSRNLGLKDMQIGYPNILIKQRKFNECFDNQAIINFCICAFWITYVLIPRFLFIKTQKLDQIELENAQWVDYIEHWMRIYMAIKVKNMFLLTVIVPCYQVFLYLCKMNKDISYFKLLIYGYHSNNFLTQFVLAKIWILLVWYWYLHI